MYYESRSLPKSDALVSEIFRDYRFDRVFPRVFRKTACKRSRGYCRWVTTAANSSRNTGFRTRSDVLGSFGPSVLPLVRIIHHSRGASLGLRYHSAFASLTNTGSIRSVTEITVITNTFAIHSLSGELSRLELFREVWTAISSRVV